jgi:hypothetical protein
VIEPEQPVDALSLPAEAPRKLGPGQPFFSQDNVDQSFQGTQDWKPNKELIPAALGIAHRNTSAIAYARGDGPLRSHPMPPSQLPRHSRQM